MYKRSCLSDIFLTAASSKEIHAIADLLMSDSAVREVWLFGSAARGEMRTGEAGYHKPSDLDFFLVVDTDDEAFPTHVRLLTALGRAQVRRPVDLVVWSRGRWAEADRHALGRAIKREGRLLRSGEPSNLDPQREGGWPLREQ